MEKTTETNSERQGFLLVFLNKKNSKTKEKFFKKLFHFFVIKISKGYKHRD